MRDIFKKQLALTIAVLFIMIPFFCSDSVSNFGRHNNMGYFANGGILNYGNAQCCDNTVSANSGQIGSFAVLSSINTPINVLKTVFFGLLFVFFIHRRDRLKHCLYFKFIKFRHGKFNIFNYFVRLFYKGILHPKIF